MNQLRKIVTILVLFALSAACGPMTPTSLPPIEKDQNYSSSIEVGDHERTYYVHLPSTFPPNQLWPVLITFNGYHYPVEQMRARTNFDALADEQGFVAVYPQGHNEMWQSDDFISLLYRTDDIKFVSALLDEILNDLPVDQTRISDVGSSNGGFFVNHLACDLYDRIAAFGSVGGTMTEALLFLPEPCNPPAPVPIVFIHGTEDTRVRFYEKTPPFFEIQSASLMSVPDTIDFWVGVNDCELTPTLVELPDEHDDGTQITKTVYGSCQEGAEVVLYTVEGGSHSWPGYTDLVEEGIEAGVGHTSADLDASAALWDFVSKFSLP